MLVWSPGFLHPMGLPGGDGAFQVLVALGIIRTTYTGPQDGQVHIPCLCSHTSDAVEKYTAKNLLEKGLFINIIWALNCVFVWLAA